MKKMNSENRHMHMKVSAGVDAMPTASAERYHHMHLVVYGGNKKGWLEVAREELRKYQDKSYKTAKGG